MDKANILRHLREREINDSINRSLHRKWHVTDTLINRLGLEKELEGHQGCVNCLEWNSEGQILASASDDFQVILWNPFTYKKIHKINTGHHGNIFSVKFLPCSNDRIVVTGAGDCQTLVHDINERGPISICTCPMGRVKRLATSPNVPHIYWSAAEDGVIRQYDIRSPHCCSLEGAGMLVYLKSHLGSNAEAKCLAINPCRPELLAVGANDPFVRLYDRRMIKVTCMTTPTLTVQPTGDAEVVGNNRFRTLLTDEVMEVADNLPVGCVQYFVAGHLPVKNPNNKYKCIPATYVTFGPDGVDLLVNLGGEQIYLFDILRQSSPKSFNLPKYALPKEYGGSAKPCTNGYAQHVDSAESKKKPLPADIEDLKLSANTLFDGGEYSRAIRIYNEAIMKFSQGSLLYGNRAAAYMKRNWNGDMYAALRDCHTTLNLDPNHVKAFFRLARCLYELDWREEAKQCLEAFKIRFPEHATSHACKALEKDISTPRSSSPETKNSKPRTDTPSSDLEFSDVEEDLDFVSQSQITNRESAWREKAFDYEKRFYGHCNTTTDIKEANFFGSNGQYIMAGSDDGSIYFWERESTNNVRILKGDSSIVNCLQPHPSSCLLASSGIDTTVRLWSPQPEDGKLNDREVLDRDNAASMNQRRMKTDPFDVVMRNMRFRLINQIDQLDEATDEGLRTYNCRTS
ncbi:hypothetical protein LSTR_LSTR012519 [Laodelphax striatellus]|uniref:WD and tetratricopeptide repeats protein 1 n=1 Tax=Laodelphax striatellus TaxID=195883 RepID=A0A482XL98_LAOST|nr:hypothetical protein LSTR_LSTR012519 [Laodelphax striatellus]